MDFLHIRVNCMLIVDKLPILAVPWLKNSRSHLFTSRPLKWLVIVQTGKIKYYNIWVCFWMCLNKNKSYWDQTRKHLPGKISAFKIRDQVCYKNTVVVSAVWWVSGIPCAINVIKNNTSWTAFGSLHSLAIDLIQYSAYNMYSPS